MLLSAIYSTRSLQLTSSKISRRFLCLGRLILYFLKYLPVSRLYTVNKASSRFCMARIEHVSGIMLFLGCYYIFKTELCVFCIFLPIFSDGFPLVDGSSSQSSSYLLLFIGLVMKIDFCKFFINFHIRETAVEIVLSEIYLVLESF